MTNKTHHEAMLDAQSQCLPCKLCGGKAVINDAGAGAGYYIKCENSATFRPYQGCLIDQRRVSGWAYNVMEWWNRLMASPASPVEGQESNAQRVAEALLADLQRQAAVQLGVRCDYEALSGAADLEMTVIVGELAHAAIRALPPDFDRGKLGEALAGAFRLIDGMAGAMNGIPNEPQHDDQADLIASDLAAATGVAFDESWPANVADVLACPRAAVEPFLAAILAQSPNGEPVTVAYYPNGDWSVYDRPRAALGERVALLAELLPLIQKAAGPNGWDWMFPLRVKPVDGKPTIVSHKGGNLFRGYIGTWQEADLLVALANAAPRIIRALQSPPAKVEG